MEKIRFIDLEVHSAYENMAIDESIMLSMMEGSVGPTLRFYRWKPTAVSIGTFQGMNDEVDVDFCRSNDIDVIRRITGGGAVYHDYDGEITYSILLPKGHRLAPDDIVESYKILCEGVIKGVEHLGIHAIFKPVNDVISNGKKISGNAQTRRHSCVLQHGTVLLDLDVSMMFQALKVPLEKISDKMIADVRERVTSISDVLGRKVRMDELRDALKKGFSDALHVELVSSTLTNDEIKKMEQLVVEKYSTKEWNFKR